MRKETNRQSGELQFDTIVEPKNKWFDLNLKELWKYKDLPTNHIRKLKARSIFLALKMREKWVCFRNGNPDSGNAVGWTVLTALRS